MMIFKLYMFYFTGAAGEKNMHDAEFTCALFRFIQLTCEGHNLGTQVSQNVDDYIHKLTSFTFLICVK